MMIDANKVLLDESKFLNVRKKPIIVKAIQINNPDGFFVETLEGRMVGKSGDYLIVGVNGERYPCDKEIFNKTYDVVD